MHKITREHVSWKLQSLRQRAKNKGLPFDLTRADIRNLWKATECYYTQQPFTGDLTIDRVESNKGYTRDNVVACKRRINAVKGDMTAKEARAIWAGFRKQRLTNISACVPIWR